MHLVQDPIYNHMKSLQLIVLPLCIFQIEPHLLFQGQFAQHMH